MTGRGGSTWIIQTPPSVKALLAEALGTPDLDFVQELIRQIVNAAAPDRPLDEARLNFVFSLVKGARPRDQLEAMLATQMAAVHWRP